MCLYLDLLELIEVGNEVLSFEEKNRLVEAFKIKEKSLSELRKFRSCVVAELTHLLYEAPEPIKTNIYNIISKTTAIIDNEIFDKGGSV